MAKVIGVRFKNTSKVYFFDPLEFDCPIGVNVVVETSRGMEMGEVVVPKKEVSDDKIVSPLKEVIRIATPEDIKSVEENAKFEKDASVIAEEKIQDLGLDMKLVGCEYAFDRSKIIFYFTSGGRVDFRELVKILAQAFKMRIELRQIGVRDEAKMIGGLGPAATRSAAEGSWAILSPLPSVWQGIRGFPLIPPRYRAFAEGSCAA